MTNKRRKNSRFEVLDDLFCELQASILFSADIFSNFWSLKPSIRIRIGLQPQPLDPDPDPEKMNMDLKY